MGDMQSPMGGASMSTANNDPMAVGSPSMGGDPAMGGDPTMGGDPAMGGDTAMGGDPTMGGDPAMGGDPSMGDDPAMGGDSNDDSTMSIINQLSPEDREAVRSYAESMLNHEGDENQEMMNEGKIGDAIKKFALTATLATIATAAMANPTTVDNAKMEDSLMHKVEQSIETKTHTDCKVIKSESRNEQVAIKMADSQALAFCTANPTYRVVHFDVYYNPGIQQYRVVYYLCDGYDMLGSDGANNFMNIEQNFKVPNDNGNNFDGDPNNGNNGNNGTPQNPYGQQGPQGHYGQQGPQGHYGGYNGGYNQYEPNNGYGAYGQYGYNNGYENNGGKGLQNLKKIFQKPSKRVNESVIFTKKQLNTLMENFGPTEDELQKQDERKPLPKKKEKTVSGKSPFNSPKFK